VLYKNHRAGQKPAAARFLASSALSAALSPFILLSALLPSIAAAQDVTTQAEPPLKVFGETPLTDSDDVITYDKTIDLTRDIDFGAGADGLINNGAITIGGKSTGPVTVSLLSLEYLKNGGLVDLRNGHVGDVLNISGDYVGVGNARLAFDIGPDGGDKLVAGGAVYGKTTIALQGVSAGTAGLTGDKGPVLVQGGTGSKEDAFTIENAEIGLIRYTLIFDSAAKSYRLKGVAGQRAYEALKISEGAGSVWRRSADAWSGHLASLRGGEAQSRGSGVWGEAHGQWMDRDDDVRSRQTTQGGQMGADLIDADLGETRALLGVTGGYTDAQMRFSGLQGQDVKFAVANVGGYLTLARDGYFLNALAKVDRQSIKVRGEAVVPDFDGLSYGGQLEVGSHEEGEGLSYEQVLGVSYVSTRLDDTTVLGQRLDFGDATGFMAKAGVRGSAQHDLFGGAVLVHGAAFVVHDFTIKNSLTLVSGAETERLSQDGGRTFGQVAMGLTYRSPGGVIAFLEANGDYGGGREGGGFRLGARVGF
jgi:hypothetical protein